LVAPSVCRITIDPMTRTYSAIRPIAVTLVTERIAPRKRAAHGCGPPFKGSPLSHCVRRRLTDAPAFPIMAKLFSKARAH
jgi:hypothetical protein